MQLHLPPELIARLVAALSQAGLREIGGVLMGEHIGPDAFRVKELTIQRKGGTFASFIRIVAEILGPLRKFFETTKHDYKKFNYLGEWHSHHSFRLSPSGPDHQAMLNIINDPELGAHFVVLLLVKLDTKGDLDGGLTVYLPQQHPFIGEIVYEQPGKCCIS